MSIMGIFAFLRDNATLLLIAGAMIALFVALVVRGRRGKVRRRSNGSGSPRRIETTMNQSQASEALRTLLSGTGGGTIQGPPRTGSDARGDYWLYQVSSVTRGNNGQWKVRASGEIFDPAGTHRNRG
jgi:hypothetical protein